MMDNSMLAPGYRFEPKDQELIIKYLEPRSTGQPYPRNVTHVVEKVIYGEKANPWDVLKDVHWVTSKFDGDEDGKSTIYVFSNVLKPRNTIKDSWSRFDRKAGCGTWKIQGPAKEIKFKGQLLGFTRSFSFVHNSSDNNNYRWVMHDYSLPEEIINSHHVKDKSLVLCKITRYREDKNLGVNQRAAGRKRSLRHGQLMSTTDENPRNKKLKTFSSSSSHQVMLDQEQQDQNHLYMAASAPQPVMPVDPSIQTSGNITAAASMPNPNTEAAGGYDESTGGFPVGDCLVTL